MATFKFSDGIVFTVSPGLFSNDLKLAEKAIELFLSKNSVTYKYKGQLTNPIAAELIINGVAKPFAGIFTYGKVLSAFGLDENHLVDEVAKLSTEKQNTRVIKEQEAAFAAAVEVYNSLRVEILAAADLTQEQSDAADNLLGGLFRALHELRAGKEVYNVRLNKFEATVKPLFDDAASALGLSWGECLANAFKQIMNALILVVTFGQVQGFFQTAKPVHLGIVTTAEAGLDTSFTSPAAAV